MIQIKLPIELVTYDKKTLTSIAEGTKLDYSV